MVIWRGATYVEGTDGAFAREDLIIATGARGKVILDRLQETIASHLLYKYV
jgi:hypothetical protein